MAKLTLSNVANISGAESAAIGVINANSDAIETALENTLSRDGTSPNSMGADLDMDNNDILNVNAMDVVTLTVNGVDVTEIVGIEGPTGPQGPTGDVSLNGIQTLTNKTLTQPTLTLKQSTTPTPTAEGDIQWDTDDNVIVVGDGAAQKIFVALPASTAAGDLIYLSGTKVLSRLAAGTALQTLRQNSGLTAPEWATAREVLTTARTYYVATTGNNSNNGLAVGTPFLTIQKALDTVFGTLDLGGFNVFIQVADGTYTGANNAGSPQVGAGIITVVGNTTTPANVIISTTSADCFLASGNAQYVVSGMELRTTTSGQCVHAVGAGTKIEIGSAIRFGACASSHMLAEISGLVTVAANYSIVGGAQVHMNSAAAGFINCTSRTITLTGTPAFSVVFALAEGTGTTIYAFSNTYSGSATGTRYISTWLAYIHTNGGGASYFPGNAAGSVNNSGLYR